MDKNFKARASSTNPKTTLIVFSQDHDFGKLVNTLGNIANNANGNPRATPKPPIPAVNCQAPPSLVIELARSEPNIGPVQENETTARVNAIKKTPKTPPKVSPLVDLSTQLEGNVNS